MKNISDKITVESITPKDKHAFFGYYDVSPESEDGTKILYNVAPFNDHMPDKSDALKVGYYDTTDNKYIEIGETHAWNFQEGCRLQWMSNDEVIYNDRQDDHYISIEYDIKSKKKTIYDVPVYSLDRKNRRALTYNFNRNRYSYAHDESEEKTDYAKDGIFILDLNDNSTKLLISLENLATANGTMGLNNWVEHCSFNPDGSRFCFFHRWNDENGLMQTNFCVSDLDGKYNVVIKKGFCSHFGWKNNDVLTAWARLPRGINKVQQNQSAIVKKFYSFALKIYHLLIHDNSIKQKLTNDAYIVFDFNNDTKNKIPNPDFVSDGHCTWDGDKHIMLTDTYPDSDNLRSLMLYSENDNQVYLLGKFFSYPDIRDKEKYSLAGIRCDLHPKWSYDHKKVYFDSTHEGHRGLYRVDISGLDI